MMVDNLLRSRDGGRTWDVLETAKHVQSVLRDGTMMNIESNGEHLCVSRSRDEGKTWETIGKIKDKWIANPNAAQTGPITELREGALVVPIGPNPDCCYRSDDEGKTWSDGFPICPGGEPFILELASGRLVTVARHNAGPPRDGWAIFLKSSAFDGNLSIWGIKKSQCRSNAVNWLHFKGYLNLLINCRSRFCPQQIAQYQAESRIRYAQ